MASINVNNIRTLEDVTYLLNILFTNLNNLDRTYYDMFINPEPMDITLERYDEAGVLQEVVLPNRAKDRNNILIGYGNPNGKQIANEGALYLDTKDSHFYFKQSNTNGTAFGWTLFWDISNLVKGVDFLAPNGNGSQLTNLNANNVGSGVLKVNRGGTGVSNITGIVKGNGTSAFSSAVSDKDYLTPDSLVGTIVYYPYYPDEDTEGAYGEHLNSSVAMKIKEGWLTCFGWTISKTTYARLYSVLGDRYNLESTPEGYFRVPDLRGSFIRCFDGIGANEETQFSTSKVGEFQTQKILEHSHTVNIETTGDTDGVHNHTIPEITTSSGGGSHTHTTENAGSHEHNFDLEITKNLPTTTTVTATTETLPGVVHEDTGTEAQKGSPLLGGTVSFYISDISIASNGIHSHTISSSGSHTHTTEETSITDTGIHHHTVIGTTNPTGTTVNRPPNIALLPMIKY